MKTTLTIIGLLLISLTNFSQVTGTLTDSRDEKTYKTVTIGTQTWLAENLAYKPDKGNYWAYDDNQTNVSKFGYLYDWETSNKVCPTGWHLPDDSEWTILIDYLGGNEIAGIKMKEKGNVNWITNDTSSVSSSLPFSVSTVKYDKSYFKEATNESAFTALPTGYRDYNNGIFKSLNSQTIFWSNTKLNDELIKGQLLDYNYNGVNSGAYNPKSGFSVRCVKD